MDWNPISKGPERRLGSPRLVLKVLEGAERGVQGRKREALLQIALGEFHLHGKEGSLGDPTRKAGEEARARECSPGVTSLGVKPSRPCGWIPKHCSSLARDQSQAPWWLHRSPGAQLTP